MLNQVIKQKSTKTTGTLTRSSYICNAIGEIFNTSHLLLLNSHTYHNFIFPERQQNNNY